MGLAEELSAEMTTLRNEGQAAHLSRFFKTGKGEYGEGDKFLGIKVPVTRSIVKRCRREATMADVGRLIASEWHEVRLAGFLLLAELYRKAVKAANNADADACVEFYVRNIGRGNNWDLVDLVAPYVLGDHVARRPQEHTRLFELSNQEGCLWHQRVAIVATLALIRQGRFDATLHIARRYLRHRHDLIHKATGWMLREVGKHGGKPALVEFLNSHKHEMPRTMLRYAIERFTPEERHFFMAR